MAYAIAFVTFGLSLATLASEGGARLLWLWPAFAFCAAGAAYLARAPGLLGKRADGTLRPVALAVGLPYFALVWLVWLVTHAASRERYAHEIVPGVFLGRWPAFGGLPPGVALVIDLTAEFPAPEAARRAGRYVCVPVLDGSAPPAGTLATLVGLIESAPGPVLVHCAKGHGRSALVLAAVVLARGIAGDVAGAVAHVRRERRGVWLHPSQRAALARYLREAPPAVSELREGCPGDVGRLDGRWKRRTR